MVAPVLKSFQAQVSESNAHLSKLPFTWHINIVAAHKTLQKIQYAILNIAKNIAEWKINSHGVKQVILRVHLIPLTINFVGVNSTLCLTAFFLKTAMIIRISSSCHLANLSLGG